MKNRKLNQLLVAGMISAAMMTSGISVQAADFSDDTSTVEEQSVGSAEEEAPEVEDGSEFQSDAAEASSAVAVSSANFPDAKFRQYVLDNIDTDKDKKLSAAEIKAAKTIDVSGLGISNLKGEKICPSCEREVDINVSFCPYCGTPCPTPEPAKNVENDTVSSDEDEDGSNGTEETPAEELQPEEPETEKAAETEPAQEQPVEETPVEKETMEEK